MEPGVEFKNVYLPFGKWFNFWNHQLLEGGQEHRVHAPIDSMPIFVKAGSVLPEYPVMQSVGEVEMEEVWLNVYYADYEVNSFLFEDHGDTFAYEQDIYLEKKFVVKGDSISLIIKQNTEGLYTPNYESYDFNIIGLPFDVTRITIDGKEFSNFLVDERSCLRFKSNKNFRQILIMR
jgi:alpha-glucosidase